MLVLLSPAKTLDETRPVPTRKASQPRLLERSRELIDVLRTLSEADVAALLHISDELAALNVERYQEWQPPFTRRNARQAIYLFNGDVYLGMNPRERFDGHDLAHADKTLRILSGLYGVLRPTDLIQPYRLEMGTRLRTARGASLYEFWGTTLTDLLRADLAASPGSAAVLNLASEEYAAAVQPQLLGARFVSPRFEDADEQGRYRVISFFAKRARGDMAGWLVANRVRSPRSALAYDGLGYRYDKAASTPDHPVFRRALRDRPQQA